MRRDELDDVAGADEFLPVLNRLAEAFLGEVALGDGDRARIDEWRRGQFARFAQE